jgi:hypothetical protein
MESILVTSFSCSFAKPFTTLFLRKRKKEGAGQLVLHALEVSTFDRSFGQGVFDDPEVDALLARLLPQFRHLDHGEPAVLGRQGRLRGFRDLLHLGDHGSLVFEPKRHVFLLALRSTVTNAGGPSLASPNDGDRHQANPDSGNTICAGSSSIKALGQPDPQPPAVFDDRG